MKGGCIHFVRLRIREFSGSRRSRRLGGTDVLVPSEEVVRQVLRKNKVSFVNEFNKDTVCDACQKGNSHKLPYPKSFSRSMLHWSSSSVMYGVRPQLLLEDMIFM